MSNIDILKKLEKIIESDAKNYFERFERLSLMNLSHKLKSNSDELSKNELDLIKNIINKYTKFVNQ